MKVCTTDSKHRGNLLLKKIDISGKGSRQKVNKFFGANVAATENSADKGLSLFTSDAPVQKSKLNKFFGERPPDELIVNQLEQFFPEIKNANDTTKGNAIHLKNIVRAHLFNKRSSGRLSSIMLRRQTRMSLISVADEKHVKGKMTSPIPSIHSQIQSKIGSDNLSEMSATMFSMASTVADSLESSPFGEAMSLDDTPSFGKSATNTTVNEIHPTPRPISFRWVPGRLIGQGAFGKVFHALNLDTGEFMAVKQVITGQDNILQKKVTDSLIREIELLSELDHDNIVRYHGTRTNNDISLIL